MHAKLLNFTKNQVCRCLSCIVLHYVYDCASDSAQLVELVPIAFLWSLLTPTGELVSLAVSWPLLTPANELASMDTA